MKKIPTLYNRVYKDHKIVDIENIITQGCEDALINGIATLKIDGSCCAIIDGVFYKRYDAKKGKPVPEGAIKCQEEADPITGHLPCWVKVDENNKGDKWFWNAYYNAIKEGLSLEDGTYEAIGLHFNGNPYELTYDTLRKHGTEIIKVGRTFDEIRDYLKNHYIEGIVFWLDGKPICKIKRSDFGFDWKTKKH